LLVEHDQVRDTVFLTHPAQLLAYLIDSSGQQVWGLRNLLAAEREAAG
jgi:hypothetical protein